MGCLQELDLEVWKIYHMLEGAEGRVDFKLNCITSFIFTLPCYCVIRELEVARERASYFRAMKDYDG